ncbi:MAG: carboxypeptidase regulatory-like domain-containing protein [Acidobacteriaceae bacterium]
MRLASTLFPVLLLILSCCQASLALDVTGSIRGTVEDPQHAVISDASVRAQNTATHAVRETRTDALGTFVLSLLQPGEYTVTVEHPGFREVVRSGVRVEIDSVVSLDFDLPVGRVTERVDVTGAPPLIESRNGTVGEVIDGARIAALPLNERNFLALGLLAAGSEPGTDGSENTILGSAISIDGVREQSNYFLLDGVDNNDAFLNQWSVLPSVEAIQEFEVQSSNSSAEFGRNAGGQINVALKSGGDHFHGSAFEFLRNRNLDAKNYFDLPSCTAASSPGTCAPIPPFDRDQLGGSLGGPIRAGKTFFFAADEELSERQAITRQASVPSQALRAALLATIPPPAINSAGKAVLDLLPAANVGDPLTSTRYIAAPLLTETEQMPLVRLDHHFSPIDNLSGHYALFDQHRFNPFDPGVPSFSNLPGYGSPEDTLGQNLGIIWDHVFGPDAINEARFGFNRNTFGGFLANQGNQTIPGFRTMLPRAVDQGYPDVEITGYDGIGGSTSLPMDRHNNTWNLADNFAWHPAFNGGRHQFNFGVNYLAIGNNTYIDEFSRGFWDFLGVTGNSIEDLLLGVPAIAVSVTGNTFTNLHTYDTAVYAQDDIHPNSHLMLNAGLRYEYASPPYDSGNRLSIPDLSTNSAVCSPKPNCMFLIAGTEGIPRGIYRPDRDDFAPRAGFAWRPFSTGRYVIRSAYGIFYDVTILNTNFGSRLNPPYYPIEAYVNSGTNTIQTIFSSPLVYPLSFTMPENFRDAYVQQWNFGNQLEATRNLVLDLAYVGSKGTRLPLRRDNNQPAPGGVPPYPQFTTMQQITSIADSTYNSLQARAVRRYNNGLEFLAAYTWSKSIDDASQLFSTAVDPGFPQNSNNLRAERALSDFDARQRFVASYVYQAPIVGNRFGFDGGRIASELLSHWTIGGIASVQTGRPFTVNRSVLQSRTGIQAYIDRPDQVSDPMKPGPVMANADATCYKTVSQGGRAADATHTASSWFNPCAFSNPNLLGEIRFGTAGRNSVTGPGFVDFDFSLMRNQPIAEKDTLQLRADLFNMFNHPNFDVPDRIFDDPTFGALISANAYGNRPPRQLQLAARFSF